MREVSRLMVVLAGICLVSALTLAAVNDLTEEPIAYQRRQMMVRALKTVLPPFDNQPDEDTRVIKTQEGKEIVFYQAKKGGDLTGVAVITASKLGYGGDIEVIIGFDPQGVLQGINILRHLETPGLGAKIEKPSFTDGFKGRSLDNTRWTVKKDGGDIDQITGATISPRAVVEAVRKGLELYRNYYRGEGS